MTKKITKRTALIAAMAAIVGFAASAHSTNFRNCLLLGEVAIRDLSFENFGVTVG